MSVSLVKGVSLVKVTPAVMPPRAVAHKVAAVPMMDRHERAHCADGALCTGPGCRVVTGKTARKA